MFDFGSVKEVRLSKGSHDAPEKGMCFMEMAAWFAGEEHSDKPACVSPSLGALGIVINDTMLDEPRDRLLKPLIPQVVGTYDDDAEPKRIEYIVLRAFNYAMGAVLPEYGRQVRGGVQRVSDARHALERLRYFERYAPSRHYNYDNDMLAAMKYSMKYSMFPHGDDPVRRRLADLLTKMLDRRLPYPTFEAVANVCDTVVDHDLLSAESARVAAGIFGNMAEIIPDWSVAIDTLREAIKLGRHDGFTAMVNLQARHEKLRELVHA
jgi:hypothetical protein